MATRQTKRVNDIDKGEPLSSPVFMLVLAGTWSALFALFIWLYWSELRPQFPPELAALWLVGLLALWGLQSRLVMHWRKRLDIVRSKNTVEECLLVVQERMAEILEASNDGFWEWDFPSDSLTLSPRFCKSLGIEHTGLAMNSSDWLSFLDPEMHLEAKRLIKVCLSGESDELYMKQRIQTRYGEWIWVLNRGRVLQRDAERRVVRMGGALTDITSLRLVEENLLMANHELEKIVETANSANEQKSYFLATMAHELRTPLHAILGSTDLLGSTPLSEQQKAYLHTIQGSGSDLDELIGNVLDISKIESGRLELVQAPFNVRKLMEKVVSQFLGETERKGIELRLNLPPLLDRNVEGDARRLNQVLTNLLTNAIKFTDRGQIRVSGELQQEKDNRVLLHFSVADTGKGIAREKQEHLFESFVQEGSGIFAQYGGTGLGLAICRNLVGLMEGEIWLESEEGVGSIFHFTIRAGCAPETEAAAVSPANVAPDNEVLVDSLRILVAEDNAASQFVTKELLKREGHRVTIAENGLEALNWIEQQQFDLILMDVQMPVMDGLSATRLIRERENGSRARIPIIATTANATKEEHDCCLDAGMDACLTKPLKMSLLLDTIRDLRRGLERMGESADGEDAPNKDVFSLAGALELYGGDRAILEMVIDIFVEECPKLMTALGKALDEGDFLNTAHLAHKLKGTLSQLDAGSSSMTAYQLEQAARQKERVQCQIAMEALKTELLRLSTVLPCRHALVMFSDTPSTDVNRARSN